MQAARILRLSRRALSGTVVALLAGACGDGGPVDVPTPPPSSRAIVSNPVVRAATSASDISSSGSSTTGVAYVSLPPGSIPDGDHVTIRNRETGAEATAVVVEGGFDPVAVAATAGDTLDFQVERAGVDGPVSVEGGGFFVLVPPSQPPVVVRTDPPPRKPDVPLNSRMLVVFSEPIDAGTLTGSSMQLLLDGAPVAGTLEFADEANLTATFTPAEPLIADADYTLRITQEIEDLDGDPLAGELRVPFTTVAPAPGVEPLSNQIAFTAHSQVDWENGIYNNEIYLMSVDGPGLINLTNNPANDHSPAVSPDGTRILFVTDRGGSDEIYVMNADGSGLVDLTNDPGWDGYPVWSPDGTRIAFASDRDDPGENACYLWSAYTPCLDVFVMNADGSNPVNLTNNSAAIDWEPSWSPDGTKIVFASDRDAGGTPDCPDCWEIFVMSADGSNVVKLTEYPSFNAYRPAWSPDGTKIAFTSGSAEIWVMNADGSNPVSLAAGMWPSWSPDGSQIAFTATPLCCSNVLVMNADGSDPINLSNRPAFDDYVGAPQAWSPQR